ncbi:MAG: Crp/Fnr family transcriptional regulator [Bryobacteraceae bacterium]
MDSFDERLARFEPFQPLGDTARKLLNDTVSIQTPRSEEGILYKGQAVAGAYLVLSGRLRVFTIAPNGTEATLYFLDPGETCVLALNCLFNNLLYPAWVQAETPAEVAVIPGAVYRQLFEAEHSIRNLTVQALSALVYRLMAELEQVHAGSYRQRLANLILTHASAEGLLRMTQQQIAGHLGTTREVIARLVQDLVAQQAITSQRGRITIRDSNALRQIVAPLRNRTGQPQ